MNLKATIDGLFIGRAEKLWPDKPKSAIARRPVDGPLDLQANGFIEDQQADLEAHGGPEKAIHHYPAEHMEFWRSQFPEKAGQFKPGCFGENLSTTGLNEENLCLGDILSLGTAKVQVCQGRQPCWKLNAHTGLDAIGASFRKTGRTGWYYRVLENGLVSLGDEIALIDRLLEAWPLLRLIKARFDPRLDHELAAELAETRVLSKAWQKDFSKKMANGSG